MRASGCSSIVSLAPCPAAGSAARAAAPGCRPAAAAASWAAAVFGVLLAACSLLGAGLATATPVDAYTLGAPFPKGFLYGTAVSGFQVDMGCPSLSPTVCEDRASDWYAYVTSPWTLKDPLLFLTPSPPSSGPGFYELYRDDLRRAQVDLHSNAIRVSLEWSRIFPNSTVGIESFDDLRQAASPTALAYYHALLAEIRARGMEPLVTVSHYTLPSWIHDAVGCHVDFLFCQKRGWDDPDTIVPEIAKFAGFVGREFGREVDLWATLNGPFSSVVLSGFLLPSEVRSNPPGVYLQAVAAKRAMRAMVEAHARMYDAIRAADQWSATPGAPPATIGLLGALLAVAPATQSPGDVRAAADMRYLINGLFLNAVANGDLDVDWDGHPVHRLDLAGRLDYIGINYYTLIKVKDAPVKLFTWITPYFSFDPPGEADNFAPQALYDVIKETAVYGKPIYVTETGIDAAPDAAQQQNWLLRSLAATKRAIADGYDVRGYFLWSLIDNYEWNRGTTLRFGLYDVDPQDAAKKRQARPAAQDFSVFGAARQFPELTPHAP